MCVCDCVHIVNIYRRSCVGGDIKCLGAIGASSHLSVHIIRGEEVVSTIANIREVFALSEPPC